MSDEETFIMFRQLLANFPADKNHIRKRAIRRLAQMLSARDAVRQREILPYIVWHLTFSTEEERTDPWIRGMTVPLSAGVLEDLVNLSSLILPDSEPEYYLMVLFDLTHKKVWSKDIKWRLELARLQLLQSLQIVQDPFFYGHLLPWKRMSAELVGLARGHLDEIAARPIRKVDKSLNAHRQGSVRYPNILPEVREFLDKLLVDSVNQEREAAEKLEQERLARLERERQEEAERQREEARQQELEHWQGKIADRCKRIVTVFNGVFGLDIDADAVLSGEVTGTFASITSGGGGSMGLYLVQRPMLLQAAHGHETTWLEIEAGDLMEEMQATLASTNFLVWHELGHLAPAKVVKESLVGAVMPDPADEFLAQARETVIDAIGLRLGESIFSCPTYPIAHEIDAEGRRSLMVASHHVLAERVCRKYTADMTLTSEELDENEAHVAARLLAEFEVHQEIGWWQQDVRLQDGLRACLTKEARRALPYLKRTYKQALTLNVLTIPFRQTLGEEDEEDEQQEFTGLRVVAK